jgi:hypothetical protein
VQLYQVVIQFLFQSRTDKLIFKIALQKKSADCEQAAEQRAKQQKGHYDAAAKPTSV